MDEQTRDPTVEPPPSGTQPTGWRVGERVWEHASLRGATVHGVRLFNAEAYHESHDCFEEEWFNYGAGTDESAFLHGMVQVAAGAYKSADVGDPDGMQSLFETALQYLHGIPEDFYGVDVQAIRTTLQQILDGRSSLAGWKLRLDGGHPEARDEDYAYVAHLE